MPLYAPSRMPPMTTVRLSQHAPDDQGQFPIEIELDHGARRRRVRAVTAVSLTEADRQDLHWYLEEYLEQTYDPHPKRAARIEARMEELGDRLFRDLFQADEDAADLWATLRPLLPDARFEIASGVQEGTAIPWELLRDPRLGRPLALRAAAFVRSQSNAAVPPVRPKLRKNEKLRILLVICRPGLGDDVPFRSVASRLLKAVTEAGRARIDLTVLRPPSFEQLSRVLREAKKVGTPFHIVHFDGHGAYLDRDTETPAGGGGGYNPRWLGARKGKHGYLAFENPDDEVNETLVGGPELGALLHEAEVPVLMLNACRSAHAEDGDDGSAAPAEHQQQIRAFGSLAQEVVDAGVGGVLAMRYNVYVVTAAQYVGELYTHLAAGDGLAEAATAARRNLADNPTRRIAGDSVDLQDWLVPVLYEANPIRLLPPAKGEIAPMFDGGGRTAGDGGELPPSPDIGFIGRDETLLALDRAFDRHRVVLLHGFAGSGKTSTAAEFARWYRDTGGLGDGVILFDSFEQVQTLPRLLDKLGGMFGEVLEKQGIRWLALSEDKRRNLALDILRQVPVFWIWDNVEPVAGFPAGTPSQWSDTEQAELRAFLAAIAAGGGRSRILLTSRRDERGWLGDVPARVAPPPMPMAERLAMAEELARRHGRGAGFSWTLLPLLEYSQGNPMTLTVLVGQALRDKLTREDQVAAYVARLRSGEAAFDDDLSQGRTRSLGASLDYGFRNAFDEEERKRLALLHLFQGIVNVNSLVNICDLVTQGAREPYRDLAPAKWLPLLDRAAEIGLLMALGHGLYRIHPALPWFLKSLFDATWSPNANADNSPQHAYARALAATSSACQNLFADGQHEVIAVLQAEETNILHALRLSLQHRWRSNVIGIMQGLSILYTTTGRWTTLARLVADAKPLVCDPATGGPLVGLDDEWAVWMDHEIDLARQSRDHKRHLQLLRNMVDWERHRTAALLEEQTESLTPNQRNNIRSLASSLQQLGVLLTEHNDAEAVERLSEAYNLCRRLGDQPAEAIAAFSIGNAHLKILAVRNLDKAEQWYQTSLSLRSPGDAGIARCHGQLGSVALKRFGFLLEQTDAKDAKLKQHLQDAEAAYKKALATAPGSALRDLATYHTMLGVVYDRAGLLDVAAEHFELSIRFEEKVGNRFGAGQSRCNLALLYLKHKRLPEARDYANAALADFRSYGDNAAESIATTERLLSVIDAALAPG